MSSWTRTPAKNPPLQVVPFARLSVSDTVSAEGVAEVKQWPNPLARRQAERQTNTIEYTAPPPPGEVRGFPEPATRRKPQAQPQQPPQPALRPLKSDALKITQIPAATDPQVTVIIPLVSTTDFLEDALLSVKRQSYSQWCGLLGLVNLTDAQRLSVETTLNNTGLTNRFAVVTVVYDTRSGSRPAAITELADKATTPFVAHLDARDIWLPKKLELQLQIMEEKSVDIVGTLYREFGESSKSVNLPVGTLYTGDFERSNPLMLSSVLMKRDLAIFTDEFTAFDYDCWVRSHLKGVTLFNLDAVQVLRRITRSTIFNTVDTQPELIRQKYLQTA
uniref:Glycosyltransferase 2-like domain-containing protein n=1 Tax=viral metagenome TaxID=1070528 RepID=A0A6C0DTF8_9ZZZZ